MSKATVTLFSVKGSRLTNAEGDGNFTSLRDGVVASLEKVAQDNIPTTDQGPIYVPGQGPMEWNATVNAYVAMGGGAKGGGADKIFYLNDQHMTADTEIPPGQNARATGPLTIDDGVTFTVSDGGRFVLD